MYDLIKQKRKTPKPLVKNFSLWTGTKYRKIAEPNEPLKTQLKTENQKLSELYEELLIKNQISEIPHAYRQKHNVRTNAKCHKNNDKILKFDFSNFYDSVRWEYIKPYLKQLYNDADKYETEYKECFINPKTNGITQGSPCSGTLAGLVLIPFWKELKETIKPATITQYSDDLTISNTNLSKKELEKIIKKILKKNHLNLKINAKKTKEQRNQFRKITGVSINDENKTTCNRNDYRYYRSILHSMKTNGIEITLKECNIKISKFLGKLEYMRFIDETNKINNLKNEYIEVLSELKSKK